MGSNPFSRFKGFFGISTDPEAVARALEGVREPAHEQPASPAAPSPAPAPSAPVPSAAPAHPAADPSPASAVDIPEAMRAEIDELHALRAIGLPPVNAGDATLLDIDTDDRLAGAVKDEAIRHEVIKQVNEVVDRIAPPSAPRPPAPPEPASPPPADGLLTYDPTTSPEATESGSWSAPAAPATTGVAPLPEPTSAHYELYGAGAEPPLHDMGPAPVGAMQSTEAITATPAMPPSGFEQALSAAGTLTAHVTDIVDAGELVPSAPPVVPGDDDATAVDEFAPMIRDAISTAPPSAFTPVDDAVARAEASAQAWQGVDDVTHHAAPTFQPPPIAILPGDALIFPEHGGADPGHLVEINPHLGLEDQATRMGWEMTDWTEGIMHHNPDAPLDSPSENEDDDPYDALRADGWLSGDGDY